MANKMRFLWCICGLFCLSSALGQYIYRDFQVWQNFEIEYNLSKKWLGQIQQQARFSENSTRFAYYYFDCGVMYKVTKNIRVNLDYIFIQKKSFDGSYSTRHQYNFFLNFRKKIRYFTFFNRVLTEGQYVDPRTSERGKILQDIYFRDKVTARYMLTKKISPFVANEIYFKLDGKEYEQNLNRNRVSTGFLYKVTRHWLLEMFYMFETNFNVKTPSQNFVFGMGLSRSFYQ